MKSREIICTCSPKDICEGQLDYTGWCKSNTGCFRALAVEEFGAIETFGCFMDSNHMHMSCSVGQLPHFSIKCCSSHNFCNSKLSVELLSADMLDMDPSDASENNPSGYQSQTNTKFNVLTTEFIIIGVSTVLIMISLIIGATFLRKYLQQGHKLVKNNEKFESSSKCSTVSRNANDGSTFVSHKIATSFLVKSKLFPVSASNHRPVCSFQDKRSAVNNCLVTASPKTSSTYMSHYTKTITLKYPIHYGNVESKNLQRFPTIDASQYNGDQMTSGSGRGSPHLVEQTIARQIVLLEQIGRGRFGSVWRGLYGGESVAVKVFSSLDEKSWVTETRLFTMFPLRHENVVGYITSDIISRGSCTQLWIVMQHHANGSLFDYLQNRALDVGQALLLAQSAAAGLWYLHSLIVGVQVEFMLRGELSSGEIPDTIIDMTSSVCTFETDLLQLVLLCLHCACSGSELGRSKLSIVHGDVKSKNILVQSNGTCCIADLGLALIDPANSGLLGISPRHRMRTIRYMAPELLQSVSEGRIADKVPSDTQGFQSGLEGTGERTYEEYCLPTSASSFESLKAADVYAYSLVLWEIFRAACNPEVTEANEYLPPYGEFVPMDPCLETMLEVVCQKRLRPTIPDIWNKHPVARCGQLMRECWHEQPEFRLTMLRVKKNLTNLLLQNRLEQSNPIGS